MPELPEVEVLRTQLSELLPAMISKVEVNRNEYLPTKLVEGHTLESLARRGKYLLGHLTGMDGVLLLHMGMTGQLLINSPENLDHVHVRFHLVPKVGEPVWLAYRDPRRFGRVAFIEPEDMGALTTLNSLGPEPLSKDFNPKALYTFFQRTSLPVKLVLLNQKAVAGIGNYIADEALWRAKVNPNQKSSTLNEEQTSRIVASVKKVIRDSLKAGGNSMKDYLHMDGSMGSYRSQLKAYGRAGLPCERCGRTLSKTTLGGRGTTFCAKCQP
jgi:formamidopyrimidine-DNA glycosylase